MLSLPLNLQPSHSATGASAGPGLWPRTLGLLVFTTEKQGASEEASLHRSLRPSTTGSGEVQKH